jgi:AcrR family transcriptional regulator
MNVAFSRKSEQHRRQAFIRATMTCLAEHGYHGTSVRKIAAQAGVTPGLLTHYYTGKEQLIADAYRHGADLTREHAQCAANAAGRCPVARFQAFVAASFTGPDIGADIFRVWLNFWAVTVTEPLVRQAHAETYADYRNILAGLIAAILKAQGKQHTQDDVKTLAIGTNAIIDGLWLERGLDPETFDAGQAARIVCRFAGATLGVDLSCGQTLDQKGTNP